MSPKTSSSASPPKGKLSKIPFEAVPSFTTIEVELKPHFSAPSYLDYLKESELPPFKLPAKAPTPCLLAGPRPPPLVSEHDVVEMIAASEPDPANGMKKFLSKFLIKKDVVKDNNITELNFVVKLVIETVDYGAQHDFDALKLSMLINIYLATHLFFKWYYWSNPKPIWAYFEELIIRHSISCTPEGQEYFSPLQCYDIMTHFHTMYMSNLPLIHILTFGVPRLRLSWPLCSPPARGEKK